MTSPDRDRVLVSRRDVAAMFDGFVAGVWTASSNAPTVDHWTGMRYVPIRWEIHERLRMHSHVSARDEAAVIEGWNRRAPVAFAAPSALEAFEGAADVLAREAVDVALGREGGQ